MDLSPEEHARYRRQIMLAEVGAEGQRRLKNARILAVGAGGLGSPAAIYLAAAGVGCLGLVDPDVVEAANLHRQILHPSDRVGRPKTESAVETLRRVNPGTTVETHPVRLDERNAEALVSAYDLVVDGTDNLGTRYVVNAACASLRRPYVYGSVFRFEGQVSVFDPPATPCYRCLYAEPPPPELVPDPSAVGLLGVVPGLIGLVQATEAIKIVIGAGAPLKGRLLVVDALGMQFREMQIRRDPHCPVCSSLPTGRRSGSCS